MMYVIIDKEQNITGVVARKEEAKHNADKGDPLSKLPPAIVLSFKLEKNNYEDLL